jgi:hypothetical protein
MAKASPEVKKIKFIWSSNMNGGSFSNKAKAFELKQ